MIYVLLLFIFSILIVIFTNFLASYLKILIYKPNLNHKEKFNNTILNTGGSIFFLYLTILYLTYDKFIDLNNFLFLAFTFLVGFFSDIKKNFNANLRLLISFLGIIKLDFKLLFRSFGNLFAIIKILNG